MRFGSGAFRVSKHGVRDSKALTEGSRSVFLGRAPVPLKILRTHPIRVERTYLRLKDVRFHCRVGGDERSGFGVSRNIENDQRDVVPVVAVHAAGNYGAA